MDPATMMKLAGMFKGGGENKIDPKLGLTNVSGGYDTSSATPAPQPVVLPQQQEKPAFELGDVPRDVGSDIELGRQEAGIMKPKVEKLPTKEDLTSEILMKLLQGGR